MDEGRRNIRGREGWVWEIYEGAMEGGQEKKEGIGGREGPWVLDIVKG